MEEKECPGLFCFWRAAVNRNDNDGNADLTTGRLLQTRPDDLASVHFQTSSIPSHRDGKAEYSTAWFPVKEGVHKSSLVDGIEEEKAVRESFTFLHDGEGRKELGMQFRGEFQHTRVALDPQRPKKMEGKSKH